MLRQAHRVVVTNLTKHVTIEHLPEDVKKFFLRGESKACGTLPALELLLDVTSDLLVQIGERIADLLLRLIEVDACEQCTVLDLVDSVVRTMQLENVLELKTSSFLDELEHVGCLLVATRHFEDVRAEIEIA